MTSNFKGKHHTKKSKIKISKNNGRYWLGKKRPEIGKKISKALKGIKLSDEHKKNLSKAKLGKPTNKRAGLGWKKYDLPLLRETDWAYIAGIIDGEGSIFIQNNGKYKIVNLTISNTDLDMLEWMKNKLNDGTLYKRKLEPNRKQCYVWQSGAHKVVYSILIKMLPYLKIKREKAIEAISFIENKEIKS